MQSISGRLAFGLLLLAPLAGCATRNAAIQPCPVAGVLGDAETRTAFRPGSGREPTDVANRTTIGDVEIDCRYTKKRHVIAKVAMTITVQRGQANSSQRVEIPYFVAVTRGDRYILARKVMTHTFKFAGAPSASAREEVRDINIPLAHKLTGAAYQVIVGLALTPEEVAYNRQQKAARIGAEVEPGGGITGQTGPQPNAGDDE